MVWPFFTTYSIDYDVDVADLRVRDLGDVEISLLDVPAAHRAIEAAADRRADAEPRVLPDHDRRRALAGPSTAARVQGWPGLRPLGLIQFDAHMDFQTGEHGPHNGTPIRTILEEGIVDPRNLVQIGIAGFVQAEWHARWGRDQGATIFTSRDVATRGMAPLLEEAMEIAGRDTEAIYVTFDIDCFDQAYAPGPAHRYRRYHALASLRCPLPARHRATGDGFRPGRGRPHRAIAGDITARLATKLMLTFLAGYRSRPAG